MSKLVVTGLMISDAGKRVPTQKLAKIKKITAKCGADGTAAVFTVTSDGGQSKNWAVTAVVLDNRVFVMQMGVDNAPVYELEERGRDLCLTQTTN